MKKILLLICIIPFLAQGQSKEKSFYRAGFHYGTGTIDNFLFNDEDYAYEVNFYKLQLYYKLKEGFFDLDILLQPEYNRAQHELLNFYFVNTPEERERFMQPKYINEYIFNIGMLLRKRIWSFLDIYMMGSIGPGYFDQETERLAKGFAFSDNIALGITLQCLRSLFLDVRPSFRHVSNANLKYPNSGYNSLNIEFGVSYDF